MARAIFFYRANIKKKNYRVKTPEGSFGEQSVSGDHGDDVDLGSDDDVGVWDSSSLDSILTEGAVPKILAGLKLDMSIGLDFLQTGESSRYDTAIDPGTSQSHLQCPHARSQIH
jgi:hypothetical protein